MKWTVVNSIDDVPVGLWLVKVAEPSHGLYYHTAAVRDARVGRFAIVGGLFGFDARRVVAYAPIPEFSGGEPCTPA